MSDLELAIAATGAANLASVEAMCARAGVRPSITDDPEALYRAPKALLPGVGAFGAAMARLRASGLDAALAARVAEGLPTMGICLGMQMFFDSSEETPGVAGIGALHRAVGRFGPTLPLPQLGWNRVVPAAGDRFLRPGWAYFANSYRVSKAPAGYSEVRCDYGEPFAAAIEGRFDPETGIPAILLCQFHPELSGAWASTSSSAGWGCPASPRRPLKGLRRPLAPRSEGIYPGVRPPA